MSDQKWDRVKQVFQAALDRPPEKRAAFVREACGTDHDLRTEVDSLLLAHERAGSFVERPALEAWLERAAHGRDAAGRQLQPGDRLGPYEIAEPLGAGGMGEVFKARDTRLDRTVAIKILPPYLRDDSALKQRFEREAKTLATLSHPHICTVFDVGRQVPSTGSGQAIDFLVMEYLEGDTLADRLGRSKDRRLQINEALTIAIQIAGALAAAHRAGIVHRDLKPGNVILTRAGAKLLDFGLAKSSEPIAAITSIPTIPATLTAQGTILGTVEYMAPEQIEGKEADARTDLFAFGSVLFEMLSGRRAFEGDSRASLMGAILEREPPLVSSLQPLAIPGLDRIVRMCLVKDPDERWQSAKDLCDELKWIAAEGTKALETQSSGRALPAQSRLARRVVTMAVVVLMVVAGTLTARRVWSPTNGVTTRQFVLLPPEGGAFGSGAGDRTPAFTLSPDGRRIAFVATVGSRRSIWVRSIDSLDAVPLSGTEGVQQFTPPCWSPDGSAIAFVQNGKLKRVSTQGGTPVPLADAPNGQGITWNREGTIVFAPSPNNALLRVADTGGTPSPVTRLGAGDLGHVFPQFLPDGRHFLYLVRAPQPRKGIYVGSIDSLDERRIRSAREKALYAPPGHLLFLEEGRLLALAFDSSRLAVSGDPIPVTESVAYVNTDGRVSLDVSATGTLAYRVSGIGTASQPVWVDRSGKTLGTAGDPGDYSTVSISPDGTRLAVELHDLRTGTGDLWTVDLERRSTTRVTFDGMHHTAAVWSPDGRELVFTGRPDGGRNLHLMPLDGSAPHAPLLPLGIDRIPSDWSRDGRYILFDEGPDDARRDLWTLKMPERAPAPYLKTEFNERRGTFSPNGRWVAYMSNETGREEIYVRAFPDATDKVQISSNGGSTPRWSRNGDELFFVGPRNMVHAVRVRAGGAVFVADMPQALFTAERFLEGLFATDGQRFFIVPTPVQSAPPITVVEDWTAILRAGS